MTLVEQKIDILASSPPSMDEILVLDSTLSREEILLKKMIGKRDETVLVEGIILENKIIIQSHADELQDSMTGNNGKTRMGQLIPVLLRARFNEDGKIVHDIIDGFHRTEALANGKIPTAKAVVLYGIDEETFYDLRLMMANSTKGTQFARMAEWMQMSYKETEWFQKGLKISQVFGLAAMDSSGIILNLTNEEAERAKQWALQKARVWQSHPASILANFRIIEHADPTIVREVRSNSGGGHKGGGVINVSKLGEVVEVFPDNWDIQKEIISKVKIHNYSSEDIKPLSRAVAIFQDNETIKNLILENSDLVIAMVKDNEDTDDDLKTLLLVFFTEEKLVYKSENKDIGKDIFDGIEIEAEEVKHTTFEEIDIAEPETHDIDTNGDEKEQIFPRTFIGFHEPRDPNYDTKDTMTSLKAQVERLNEALNAAQIQLESHGNQTDKKDSWWETFPSLSTIERECMLLAAQGKNLEEIAREKNFGTNKIAQFIRSAFRKYYSHEHDRLDDKEAKELGELGI